MQNWPADRVERRPIEALVPYARNSRTHSDEQVAQIAASMKEWGWTNPVLVDESGMIIAGHGRVLAARKLGFAEVPVMVAAGWSEAQKRAYVLADNQLALNAGWDMDVLKNELAGLKEWEFDLSLLGFEDLDELLLRAGADAGDGRDAGISYVEHFAIVVTCESESDQTEKYDSLVALGYTCKVLVN